MNVQASVDTASVTREKESTEDYLLYVIGNLNGHVLTSSPIPTPPPGYDSRKATLGKVLSRLSETEGRK